MTAQLAALEAHDRILSPDYWIEQSARANEEILDRDGIRRFNTDGFEHDPCLVDIVRHPAELGGDHVRELIEGISRPYDKPLHFHAGGPVGEEDYQRYRKALGLGSIPGRVAVRFGLVLERADMRAWPTADTAYKSEETIDLDRFQENGLFPGEPVAILHRSEDHAWYFARSYNYAAWVRRDQVVLAERKQVIDYASAGDFIVVTGAKVSSNFNPRCPAVSERQFDMGARLPRAGEADLAAGVDGQNPGTSHAVRLPTRRDDGSLQLRVGLIARSQDVHPGYLPYTRANLLRQGFKFLGERYGWGHSYNARDCSGLVTEVYRSMGVLLPRNTRQQIDSPLGETLHFGPGEGQEARMAAIRGLRAGDLVYSPGHVMIYVGSEGGESYVLHDTSSNISFSSEATGSHQGILNGVSVTPLLTLRDDAGRRYVDEMLAIKKIH